MDILFVFISERRLQMIRIDNEKSYIAIVEEFSDMIFRIAYQNLLNTADSEDIVQDVFVKLLKHKTYEFKDKEHLKAWLIRITINQCVDWKRKFFRNKEIAIEDYEIPFEEKEESLVYEISQLPKDDRNIIYLHYYEGYTIREIAEILGKKQNTVNSKLTRARGKLKRIIEEEETK